MAKPAGLKSCFVLIFLCFSCVSANDKPNIVFILADDLGWNDIGYSAHTDMQTPYLDNLAEKGLKLDWYYTHSVCTPSRAAILTGKYAYSYGLGKTTYEINEKHGLDTDLTLLPERMKNLGYETHLVGKWHLGYCKPAYLPYNRGFNHFYGFLSGAQDYYTHLEGDFGLYDYWKNDEVIKNNDYSTWDYARYVEDAIDKNDGKKPLFLYLSLQNPHTPLESPPNVKKDQDDERAIFREMVKAIDKFTEKVVNALKKANQWDNTILIFTSDNGGHPSHGGNNWPLRGRKHTLWEGGTRVRSFLHGKQIPQGHYPGLFHVVDWTPTILSMAGHDHTETQNERFDGIDQWEAIKQNVQEFEQQPRSSFFYGLEFSTLDHDSEYSNFDGRTRLECAVRKRFRNADGELKDYKFIWGGPGGDHERYALGEEVVLAEHDYLPYYKHGVLFNMDNADEDLEKWSVDGHDEIKEDMKQMLLHERDTNYIPQAERIVANHGFATTTKGVRHIKTGWC